MAFIRLMLAPFAGVECVAKQTGNWRDLREITRGFEPRKGEFSCSTRPPANDSVHGAILFPRLPGTDA